MKTNPTSDRRNMLFALIILTGVVLIVALIGLFFIGNDKGFIEGEAVADEYRVSSKVPGRILKFYVAQGDWVNPGDTLVTLTAPDVEAKLTQVEAVRTAAEALNEKSHSPARREVLLSAYEMWQKAIAGQDIAQKTYDRINRLYQEGVMTAQQHDEALANLNAMKATEKAARLQYEMARQGAQLEDKEITAAQVRQAQGGVEEVESFVKETVLVAPTSGEVSTIYPQRDELVGSGAPIMSITLMGQLWGSFNVREDLLRSFPIGTRFNAYSPALGIQIPMQVTYLKDLGTYAAWKATKVTGEYDLKTFEVKAVPTEAIEGLRPGMSLVIQSGF